jgi:Protein of unknown function (DUF3800)
MPIYHIYSDESNTTTGNFMIIGGIIFPAQDEKSIIQGITDKTTSMGLVKEIAWGSLSNSNLDRYFELFKYIFKLIDEGKICLKMIIVPKNQYNNKKYNNFKENPFYKMYFQLLYHKFCKTWYKANKEALFKIFPDEKSSNQSLLDLKIYLNNHIRNNLSEGGLVLEIVPQVSKNSIIIQMIDLVIGCYGNYSNNLYKDDNASIAKKEFIYRVQCYFKMDDFTITTPSSNNRFEVWNFKPKK